MSFREQITKISDTLYNGAYAIFAEFPAVDPKDIEDLTAKIYRIAQLVHLNPTKHQEEIGGLWRKVTAKIDSPEKAKLLDLPIRMLLWRYELASISKIAESGKPMPEDEHRLLAAEAVVEKAVIPDDPMQLSRDCIERLDLLLESNFPNEYAQAKSLTCGEGVRASLNVFVKIIAPSAAFGAGLTAATIPLALGYSHPALDFICLALGVTTFGSIYMGARVELVSFKTWKIGLVSVLCILTAFICSAPSAELNYKGVDNNIKSPPIGWNSTKTDDLAYTCGGTNYAANLILGQGQLIMLWILGSLWRAHYQHMPTGWHKGIFIVRKVSALMICAMSMLCYFEAGRQLPTIKNTYGSYIVSFLKNITDFATITLATSQLPWGGLFSSPHPWYSRLYSAITGLSIGAVLAKYTYDDRNEMLGGFFDDSKNALLILLAATFVLNQHYYYPFGKHFQWLVQDIIWGTVIKGIGKAFYWGGYKVYSCCRPTSSSPQINDSRDV